MNKMQCKSVHHWGFAPSVQDKRSPHPCMKWSTPDPVDQHHDAANYDRSQMITLESHSFERLQTLYTALLPSTDTYLILEIESDHSSQFFLSVFQSLPNLSTSFSAQASLIRYVQACLIVTLTQAFSTVTLCAPPGLCSVMANFTPWPWSRVTLTRRSERRHSQFMWLLSRPFWKMRLVQIRYISDMLPSCAAHSHPVSNLT